MKRILLLGAVVVLVVISGWWWQSTMEPAPRAQEDDVRAVAACTEESLVCPDGSSVARGGEDCRMDSCPLVDAVAGKVIEQEGGYWLVTAAPETVTGATYSLPLAGQEAVLATLVDAYVRVQGTFGEGNILIIETIEELMTDPTVGIVGIGEIVFINGLKITLHEVVQDSRCPANAQCIEGGAITASFTLVSDTDTLTRNIASDEVPTPFAAFTIAIEEIAPPLLAEIEPDPAAYQLTLRVENSNE